MFCFWKYSEEFNIFIFFFFLIWNVVIFLGNIIIVCLIKIFELLFFIIWWSNDFKIIVDILFEEMKYSLNCMNFVDNIFKKWSVFWKFLDIVWWW